MRNTFFKRTLTAAAVAAAMGMSATAVAQSTTGSVTGQVLDTSNQVVESASVTILNVDTGFTRTLSVNDDGEYRFPSLPTGRYTITVNANGYSPNESQEFTVSAGSSREVRVPLSTDIERIDVTGTAISMVDTRASGTSLNIGEAAIDRIPVPRDATGVALLAPGTTQGDNRFGNLASFGGSSVAENAVYINGLNVTNFRNGLGFSDVPFEFYKEFEVLTGGYSAEFGRSTGGVINAVTKSGSNEFEAGASVFYQPSGLRETAPNTFRKDGSVYIYNDADSRTEMEANVYVSGAIIEDTLFYYAIYNPRDIDVESTGGEGTAFYEDTADDAFWGGKVDWQISSNHLLEFLAFSDSSTTDTLSYVYDIENGVDSDIDPTSSYQESGGDNWSIKYTGYLTDDLSVTALYGKNKYTRSENSALFSECALIQDQREDRPYSLNLGCADASNYTGETGSDEREAMRIDFEWYLGDHLLRFGMDREVNTSSSTQAYSGPEGAYYIISDAEAGAELPNGSRVPAGESAYISQRIRTVGGDFETEASAFYIEDEWSITQDITATIGIRNETFDNKNGSGETFVEVKDMWAPRLGLSWDINGDGLSKAYVNVGRYHLPVANNTNIRLAGNEFDQTRYFTLDGLDEVTRAGRTVYDPVFGEQIGQPSTNANGEVPDTRTVVDQDLDPMYQDEIIIGYEAAINDDWSWGIRGINRKLNGAIDDMLIDHAIASTFGCSDSYVNDKWAAGTSQYVLANPGEDMTVFTDTDCDTQPDSIATLSGESLEYPEAERTYNAVELTLAKMWDGKWSMNASYTWSQSYGNSEGLVKSDNGQRDAGLTTDFDLPQLMDGSYGYLPNDRRHTFKVYGSYAFTESFRMGANFNLSSGRPLNAFGVGHPDGVPFYGDTYYVCTSECGTEGAENYVQFPRGSYGRTPWTAKLDVNAAYTMDIQGFETEFRVDVYNLLDADGVTRNYETAEQSVGSEDSRFMLPIAYQTPRYVQLSASVKF